jgi:hypothetical protein
VAQGATIDAVNDQLKLRLAAKCEAPFKCEAGLSLEMRCPSEDAPPPKRFFGQDPITFLSNQSYFPEFAWTMQSSALVRDGVELRPKVDYVDEDTQELMMVMTFFVPKTQVGGHPTRPATLNIITCKCLFESCTAPLFVGR